MDWLRKLLSGEKTVYKVIYEHPNEAKSSFIAYRQAKVIYEEGVWVSAPEWLAKEGYLLTCFRSLYDAKLFRLQWGYAEVNPIWKCCARGIKQDLPPICNTIDLTYGCFHTLQNVDWPPGTIMAKQIKLEERVE